MHDIVRVRKNGREYNTGRAQATRDEAQILDESPYDRGGSLKPTTRANGRPLKKKTSVSAEAAKKAAQSAAQSDTAPSTKE